MISVAHLDPRAGGDVIACAVHRRPSKSATARVLRVVPNRILAKRSIQRMQMLEPPTRGFRVDRDRGKSWSLWVAVTRIAYVGSTKIGVKDRGQASMNSSPNTPQLLDARSIC